MGKRTTKQDFSRLRRKIFGNACVSLPESSHENPLWLRIQDTIVGSLGVEFSRRSTVGYGILAGMFNEDIFSALKITIWVAFCAAVLLAILSWCLRWWMTKKAMYSVKPSKVVPLPE